MAPVHRLDVTVTPPQGDTVKHPGSQLQETRRLATTRRGRPQLFKSTRYKNIVRSVALLCRIQTQGRRSTSRAGLRLQTEQAPLLKRRPFHPCWPVLGGMLTNFPYFLLPEIVYMSTTLRSTSRSLLPGAYFLSVHFLTRKTLPQSLSPSLNSLLQSKLSSRSP